MKRALAVIGLGVAAPFVAGVSFVYYVGYRATAWAFRHPNLTIASVAGAGLVWYAAQHADTLGHRTGEILHELQDKRVAGLERRIYELEHPAAQVMPVATPAMNMQQPKSIRDENFYFYFVKQGESLSSIARQLSGDVGVYRMMQQDNQIADPSGIMTGQMLRVRRTLVSRPEQVFEQVPLLDSVVLPGTVTLKEYFHEQTDDILHLNAKLGLEYTDTFTVNGQRIVYMPPK